MPKRKKSSTILKPLVEVSLPPQSNKLPSKKRSAVLTFLLLGIIALGGLFVYGKLTTPKTSGYILEKAKKSVVTEVVSESGEITSDGSTPVYSPTHGVVEQLFVQNGDYVTAGAPLFRIRSSASQQEKQSARANYLAAKSDLDSSNSNLLRLQGKMFSAWDTFFKISTNSTYENSDKSPNTASRNLPEFSVAQKNWLAAEAEFKDQQGVIAAKQAALRSYSEVLQATTTTTVTSSIDGYVSNLAYATGDTVEAKTPLTITAKPVLLLKHSEILGAIIRVGQTNISKIATGQPVVIKPDAYKDKIFQGTIDRFDSIGKNTQGVVTYDVYVSMSTDTSLKAGMTFDADITTQELSDVLSAPNSAVVTEKGMKSVRILEKDGMKYIPVFVGIKGESRTQILSGIQEGQEVIVSLTNEKAQRPGFLGL